MRPSERRLDVANVGGSAADIYAQSAPFLPAAELFDVLALPGLDPTLRAVLEGEVLRRARPDFERPCERREAFPTYRARGARLTANGEKTWEQHAWEAAVSDRRALNRPLHLARKNWPYARDCEFHLARQIDIAMARMDNTMRHPWR